MVLCTGSAWTALMSMEAGFNGGTHERLPAAAGE